MVKRKKQIGGPRPTPKGAVPDLFFFSASAPPVAILSVRFGSF